MNRDELYRMGPLTALDVAECDRIVGTHYALGGEVVEATPLTGGLGNSNYKVVVVRRAGSPPSAADDGRHERKHGTQGGGDDRDQSTDGDRGQGKTAVAYLLKVCNEKNARELQVQIDVLNLLRQHAFPASFPVARKDGAFITVHRCDAAQVELNIVLYDFLQGSYPKCPTPTIMHQIGLALAALHAIPAAAADFPPFPMGESQFRSFLQETQGTALEQHEFVITLRNELASLSEAFAADLPTGILHGDLFLENTMFEGQQLVGIIDFEEVCLGPLLLDLCMALVGCCYDNRNRLNFELVEALLQAYISKRALSPLEAHYVTHYLRYALLSVACWRFRQFNVRHVDEKRRTTHLEMLQRMHDHDDLQRLRQALVRQMQAAGLPAESESHAVSAPASAQ